MEAAIVFVLFVYGPLLLGGGVTLALLLNRAYRGSRSK